MKSLLILITALTFCNVSLAETFEGHLVPQPDHCPETGYEFMNKDVQACLKLEFFKDVTRSVDLLEFVRVEGKFDNTNSKRAVLVADEVRELEPEVLCGFFSEEIEKDGTHGENKTYYFEHQTPPADQDCTIGENDEPICSTIARKEGPVIFSRIIKKPSPEQIAQSIEKHLGKNVCFKGYMASYPQSFEVHFTPMTLMQLKH